MSSRSPRPGADAIAAIAIERCEACYRVTSNPLHAWRAYHLARVCDVAIPPWVFAVLDEWGTQHRQFQPQLRRKARTDARDWAVIERIYSLRQRPSRRELERLAVAHRLDPHTVSDPGDRSMLDIVVQVADEHALSVDRVQAIWSTWTRQQVPV